ncbi:KH domain-containing protein [Candidatus Dojkabacteria bacterium]|nr:KH domain-containing protein [Candidatus Dojkabacteria bacterium]
MEEFIKYLLENIIENPEALEISEETDDKGRVIVIDAEDRDKALIIGKGGRNIKAIRELAFMYAKKHDEEKVFLKIRD